MANMDVCVYSLLVSCEEDELKTAIKSLLGVYSALGIITLLIQLYWRYPVCSGAMGCGLSFVKGLVWSAIWPIYWWIQLTWQL
jgi:hypothetical protein